MNKESLIELVGDNQPLIDLVNKVYSEGYDEVSIEKLRCKWDYEKGMNIDSELGILALEDDDYCSENSLFLNYNFLYFEKNFNDFIAENELDCCLLKDNYVLFVTNKWAEEGFDHLNDAYIVILHMDDIEWYVVEESLCYLTIEYL